MRTATAKQSFLVVFIGCLVLVGSNPRLGQAEPITSCPDYLIIDSRGSGEPAGGISLPGAAFASEFQQLRQDATIEVVSNAYPAVGGLLSMLKAKSRIPGNAYNRSVTKGRKWLTGKIISLQKSCEKTRLYLVGYSQGAQVTGDAYQEALYPNVAGVVLFGDTRFNPDDTSAHSYGQTNLFGSLGKRDPFNDPKKVQSYCHVGDPVCGWSGASLLTNLLRMHKNYHELGEPRLAAKYFAKLEGSSTSPPPSPAPAEKWPTKRFDGTPALFLHLGASFIWPDWSSCSLSYCLVGNQAGILVFSVSDGIDEIARVEPGTADPRVVLTALGISAEEIDELLSP